MAQLPLMFKTSAKAWVYNFTRYPTSITRVGAVATVTLVGHGYQTGAPVSISGAVQTEYNGVFVITVLTADTFTYAVGGTPATPATGLITLYVAVSQILDVAYPATTADGIVYLDGTYFVMDSTATIFGSALENPLSWTALNSIVAESENDNGVAITKYLNFLIAFGQWSTEFFYTNPSPTDTVGSPLARAENMFIPMGCASPESIQQVDASVLWVAQSKEFGGSASAGRVVVQLQGTGNHVVSSPGISRILDSDSMATVFSYTLRIAGHPFYVLTLVASNITLVYDLDMELWYQWTSLTAQATQAITSLTRTDGTATANLVAHGYADGDPVTISGATQTEYNSSTNITYIDANNFSYVVSGTPASPATGAPIALGYTEGYFKPTYHVSIAGGDFIADESSGYVYALAPSYYTDKGNPINCMIRTTRIDAGTNNIKKMERVEIIGDKVAGNAYVRCSKDDYQTFSKYRKIDLSLKRNRLSRFGAVQRVSFDVRITDNVPVRLERLDLSLDGGE